MAYFAKTIYEETRFMNRLPFFFIALIVSFAAQSAVGANWFEGNFKARIFDESGATNITASCDAKGSCNLLLVQEAYKDYAEKLSEPVKNGYGVELPNNNLEFTRRVAKANPDQYSSKRFGSLLTPIRSLIESDRKFTDCLDLKKAQAGSMLLCAISGKSVANEGPMLLMTTMNPTCMNQVFCAYFFIPLTRE
jgi:hypothetical protein